MKQEKENSTVLNAVMSKFDEDRTVFIGASCGYLFIGTLKEYRVDFPKIEKEADEELKKTTFKINELIEEINAEISEENENSDGVKLNAILKKITEVKTKLRDRSVLEVYEKILDGNESGTAVIIRGSERGRYWLKKEYEEKRVVQDEDDEEE